MARFIYVVFFSWLLLLSTISFASESREIEIRVIDMKSGKGISNVTIGRERSLAEYWLTDLGTTNSKGVLKLKVKDEAGWYYSVSKAPEGYKVAGIDEVNLKFKAGDKIVHTFKLHKKKTSKPKHDKQPITKLELDRIPTPKKLSGSAYLISTVNEMPGFDGKKVTFKFYSPAGNKASSNQMELAAEIYRSGKSISEIVDTELKDFQKAGTDDSGDISGMKNIEVCIERLNGSNKPIWKFVCKLPNGKIKRGYPINFRGLNYGDLIIPDYWQSDFGS